MYTFQKIIDPTDTDKRTPEWFKERYLNVLE